MLSNLCFSGYCVLHQQHAGPKEVDKPVGAGVGTGQFFNGMLKRGHALVANAKDLEEVDPKRLGLRVFVGGVGPGFRKAQRLAFDFVP